MINRIYISIVLICLYSCTPDGFDPSLVFDEPLGGDGIGIDSNCYIPIDNGIGFQKKIKDDQYFNSIYHNNDSNYLSAIDLLIDINSLFSFVILGQGDDNLLLFKIDSSGNVLDLKAYDYNLGGVNRSLIKTVDGGYIIIGDVRNGQYYDIMVIKVDSEGNEQWTKIYGEDNYREYNHSIQQSSDGGYIILGTKNYIDWIIKTDADGNIIWTKINEGRVLQTIDEGLLWISDSSVTSISADGDTSWSKYFEGINWVKQTNDEGYIIKTNSSNLIKINKYGNNEWENNILSFRDIIQTQEGGYVIMRYTDIIKLDNQGNMEWQKLYCDEFGEKTSLIKVIQINENEYFIVGNKNFDILLMKTDSEGNTSRLN